MRKWMKGLLALMLLLCLLPCGSFGEDPSTWQNNVNLDPNKTYTVACNHETTEWVIDTPATCATVGKKHLICSKCKQILEREVEIPKTSDHNYGDWVVTKAATCAEAGTRTKTCVLCGNTVTEAIAKTSDHKFGDWVVTTEATCKANGTKTRTCAVCGKQETESIPKASAHQYGDWVVTTEATCKSAGIKTRTCAICGNKQTETIPKLEHSYGPWTVQKEATCTKDGKERRVCSLCGASQHRVVKALGHLYSEWEIIEEATDESMGVRSAVCDRCGKKVTEKFYPEGTLYRGGDNPPDAVKELQTALAELGLYKGKISGEFGSGTFNAVKSFEKNYLGMKSDGIAWPKVLKGLGVKLSLDPGGMGGPGDDPVSSDTSKVKLLLEVEQISAKKDKYAEGDEITFKWTLTNKSPKDDAMNVRLYMFKGMKPDKKTDTEIAQPETLVPGEKMVGSYVYKVTAEDTVKSKLTIGFIARCKFKKKDDTSNKVWFHLLTSSAGTGSPGGWTPPSEQQLAISKKVDNKPANNYFFVKGETIEYLITVANTSPTDVDNVILTDPLIPGLSGIGSFSLKAGEIRFFSAAYKVKAEDIPSGEVVNTVTASYTGSDGKLKSASDTAKAPVGFKTTSLYIYKTATSTPANGLFYLQGEVVTYDITVVNPTGKTYTDVRLYDDLNTDPKTPIKKIGTMKPYDVKHVTFKHHVSKFEANTLKKVINTAHATYIDPKKAKKQETSNVCVVPAGIEDSDGVIVKKVIISTPENGKYYEDAEEIRYMIEVTNNTVKDIPDMDVRDALAPLDANGFRTIYAHETLAAGETKSYPFSFLVGPGDVENTYVINYASANWTINGTDYVETYSDPVIAPTSESILPRVAKEIKLEGAACENPLTGVGEGVAEHDVTECADHTETAAKSMELVDGKAYDEAEDLWAEEIGELYSEWIENADAQGARNAEDEQAAFELHSKALENSIALVCDADEAKAIAVEEQMNKCVRLCYELHSAPETRSDSLESDHASLPKSNAGDECKHTAIYMADGSAHVVDDQCESHATATELTNALLENAEDDEDKAIAWKRAQGIWLLQLNTMYDKWYLSADESQRAIIAADRMSFDRLIEARRTTLADLYPNDPATAEEVLANMIMERTELICRLLHNAGILTD